MGYGSYTSADWSKLRESAGISEKSTASQIFKKQGMEEKFNPKFVNMREAMDSEDHPDSTPIIIGLDVTGSMGYLSEEIAKNSLHETMMKLYSTKPVDDPQLLFAAIGDVSDRAPLQVTQFESDIRIAEQLLDLWLEGRGGDSPEDFELLWYFAAKHTRIDAYEKRGKKGFIFTIGDADCHPEVRGSDIAAVFGDDPERFTSKKLAEMAGEKYEIFHIDLSGNFTKPFHFNGAIPGRIITLSKQNVSAIPEVIITVMQMVNGKSLEDAVSQWSSYAQPIVRNAVEGLVLKTRKKGFFF